MRGFRVNANSRWVRWRNRQRADKLDPAGKVRRDELRERAKAIERATPVIEAAGFHDVRHYFPGGQPSYCKCGTVQDHNAQFDRIIREAQDG